MDYLEKKVRKKYLGDEYTETFKHTTVFYKHEDWNKLIEFKKYCFEKLVCNNCGYKYGQARKQKDTFNLILECKNCLSNDILSDSVSTGYVKWLNDKQDELGGVGFEEGFPVIPNMDINFSNSKRAIRMKSEFKIVKKKK